MGHRFLPSLLTGGSERIDPAHTAAVKRWTHELLQLTDDDVVTVSELACVDPGCPLVETVVTVYSAGGTRAWSFTRPKCALTRMMLQQTLRTPPTSARG